MANIRKSFNFRTGLQVDNDNFVVNANGLVGIGTSIPQNYLLNVHGDTRVTGLTTSGTLYAGIGTVGVLSATNADVSGILSVAQIRVGSSNVANNLVGYGYTAWITNDGGVGLHTLSRVGIGTTTTPTEQLKVFGDVSITTSLTVGSATTLASYGINAPSGIITASKFVGVGSELTSLNATNISSGTLNNSRLPSDISVSGVVTATTFVGSLTGTATTATNLSSGANITAGTISDDRLPDLITSNINVSSGVSTVSSIDVGTGGTAFTASSSGRIGVGTAIPTSELQIKKSSGSLAEVVSDSGQARISVGNSVGAGNSSGVLRFGNTSGVLDIINNDIGDIKSIIHGGAGAGSTGNFKWIYGQTNAERMTLTYDGNLGINSTTPSQKLSVGGGVTVTGNVHVDSNLTVDGNITGNITLDPVLSNTNLNNTSGITTLAQLDVTSSVDFGTTTLVALGNTVAIGTGTGSDDYSLVVEQGLRADRLEVQSTGGINANAGIITASRIEVSTGYSMQGFTTAVQLYYDGTGVVLNVVGIGSTTLTLS